MLLAWLVVLTGCTESRTGFDVSVVVDEQLQIDQLVFSARLGEAVTDPVLTSDKQAVLLIVPDSWSGKSVRVEVKGIARGKVVIYGSASAEVRAKAVRSLVIIMGEEACAAACVEGTTECVGDGVRRCEEATDGCASWSPPIPCPADEPLCSDGRCGATCSDECAVGERRCTAEGKVQICGQHDSDGCNEWGPSLACGGKESCVEGACVLLCDGGPCACVPDETQRCDDVGQCRGGVRRCIDGKLGPCEWERGPSPETCDGQDNDCNGVADDGLIAPACAKQAGVCAGSRQRCDGERGWLACGESEYRAAAAALGLTYEVAETRCDKKDNDCNGKVDEPASCSPSKCGDGVCDADENATSCPADCKQTPACGDGKCSYQETTTSCPQDCSSAGCTNGETSCVDDHHIRFCLDGVWKEDSCQAVCTVELGSDEGDGCSYVSDSQKDLCLCKDPDILCTSHADCTGGQVCALHDGETKGYCTPACPTAGSTCDVTQGNQTYQGHCAQFAGELGCDVECSLLSFCPVPLICSNADLFAIGYCKAQ